MKKMLGESYSDDEDVREVKCLGPYENGACYDQSDADGKREDAPSQCSGTALKKYIWQKTLRRYIRKEAPCSDNETVRADFIQAGTQDGKPRTE